MLDACIHNILPTAFLNHSENLLEVPSLEHHNTTKRPVTVKDILQSSIHCSMQYLCCMGTSSQIIASVCLRSSGLRSFLGILQWEVSSTSNGIFSRSVMYGPQVGGLMLCQKIQHIGQSALTTYSRTDGLIENGLPSTTQPIQEEKTTTPSWMHCRTCS